MLPLTPFLGFFRCACQWVEARLLDSPRPGLSTAGAVVASRRQHLHLTLLCVVVFLAAAGVRFLYWQDLQAEISQRDTQLLSLGKLYKFETSRMLEEGTVLFPRAPIEAGDARLLVHPPGYAILLYALSRLTADPTTAIQGIQLLSDAAAAMLVFLLAAELLPMAVSLLAALLVALSPHLAYYALWLTPESLAVVPILLAVYLLIGASKRPRLLTMVAAGAALGISCWLRSNGLLLAPFFGVVTFWLLPRPQRWRLSAALVATAALVIAPITIRNWMVYGQLVPVSLGAGVTLVEGIADYDVDGRFGMPIDDRMAAHKDAEWHGREDYAANLWAPDGIARERERLKRGLAVIKAEPVWFLSVMARRAASMLRYNDSQADRWPLNTAIVPLVAAEPTFSRQLTPATADPQLALSAAWLAEGERLAPAATVELTGAAERLEIGGNDAAFGDQFASAPIAVQPHRDYLLRLPVLLQQGEMAVKITSADRRIALLSKVIPPQQKAAKKADSNQGAGVAGDEGGDKGGDKGATGEVANLLSLPFASGERTAVRLVFSNNGAASERPFVTVGKAELFELGETRHLWTAYLRPGIRGVQKNLYVTRHLTPLIGIGLVLLALAGGWRRLLLLLAVPVYYCVFQSVLHTEYRYILAIHYFLFILAAVALYVITLGVWQAGLYGYRLLTAKKT